MGPARVLRALAALTLVGACAAVPNAWTDVSPRGLLRDAVACGRHWYVVGGRTSADRIFC